MAEVTLGKPRAIVRQIAEGLDIRIKPGGLSGYGTVLLCLWLLVTIFTFVLPSISDAGKHGASVVGLTPTLGTILFLSVAIVPMVWAMYAIETVKITSRNLIYRRSLFGFGRNREYDSRNIKNMRFAPVMGLQTIGYNRAYPAWFQKIGVIVFDYGYKTYRFGVGLEEAEAEAKQLVTNVTSHFTVLANNVG